MQRVSDKIKKSVRSIMVLGLIFAAVNLILCIVTGNFFGLLDVAVIVGFSIWFYYSPKKLPAYCMLGYTVLSMIIVLCLSGTLTGWLLLIWAIGAIKTAASVNKEYAGFAGGNFRPEDNILPCVYGPPPSVTDNIETKDSQQKNT